MATPAKLEPATSDETGRRSSQTELRSRISSHWEVVPRAGFEPAADAPYEGAALPTELPRYMALPAGLEPAAFRLTAGRSTS